MDSKPETVVPFYGRQLTSPNDLTSSSSLAWERAANKSVPLVGTTNTSNESRAEDNSEDTREQDQLLRCAFLKEFSRNAVCMLFTMIPEIINLSFISRYGDNNEVAAIGLGNCLQNSIGLAVAFGLNAAFDFFVSTSHREKRLSILYLSRGALSTTIYFFLIFPLFWYSESVFILLGQPPVVSSYAAQYNRATLSGLWFVFQANGFVRFLSNQGKARYCAYAKMITAPFHVLWCLLFVVHLGWGNYGLGFANSTTWVIEFTFFLCHFVLRREEYGMSFMDYICNFVNWRVWKDMGKYLRVAIPSAIQLASQWVWWELLVIIVGLFSDERKLVTHVTVFTIAVAVSQIPSALSLTTTNFVGKAIGSEDAPLARRLCNMVTAISFIINLITYLAQFLLAPYLATPFSRDEITVKMIIITLRIAAVAGLFSATQQVAAAIMRVCRRPTFVALFHIVQNFIVNLLLVILLSFYYDFGVYGVWMAGSISCSLGFSFLILCVTRIDFDEEVEQSRKRIMAETNRQEDDGKSESFLA